MSGLNEFASPRFPRKYPSNIDCVRVIFAPASYDIVLTFKNVFQIETSYEKTVFSEEVGISTNCPNDYLEVRDGRYSFSPLIGQFCGMKSPGTEIRAKSGFMWLHFHSDGLLEYRGFMAEYEFLRGPIFGNGFNRAIGPLECIWEIHVPRWLSISIFIEEFSLSRPNQCSENLLELYAGLTAHSPMKRYCGITANHAYANQPTVFIRVFGSNSKNIFTTKFRILFSTYVPLKNCSNHSLFSCGDDICIPQELVCSGHKNCLYGRDEINCDNINVIDNGLTSGWITLILSITIIFIVVIILFIWYKPWKIPEEKVDAYLKELCTEPPPGLNQTSRQRAASRRVNSVINVFQFSGESSPTLSGSYPINDFNNHHQQQPPRRKLNHQSSEGNGQCLPHSLYRRRPTDEIIPLRSIIKNRRLHSLQISSLPRLRSPSTETVIEVAEIDESPTDLQTAETSFSIPIISKQIL
uniref:CUB domain-containing protein n=1 Tax=Panagrolaimus davidi TaxID=227884 RepID=A0A914PMU8_9BILA